MLVENGRRFQSTEKDKGDSTHFFAFSPQKKRIFCDDNKYPPISSAVLPHHFPNLPPPRSIANHPPQQLIWYHQQLSHPHSSTHTQHPNTQNPQYPSPPQIITRLEPSLQIFILPHQSQLGHFSITVILHYRSILQPLSRSSQDSFLSKIQSTSI